MLASNGAASALYITTQDQHDSIIGFAEYENCPSNILENLKNRSQTLWFYDNIKTSGQHDIDWEKYLLPIEIVNNQKDCFYYSYTKTLPFIDKDKIKSFDSYKDSLI